MTDSPKPPLKARLHAAAAGERSAAPLEALRTAGKAAYDELLRADRLRDELAVAEISLWDAPPGVGSQLVAAWNAFALQTLGEALLDADYAADSRTVGFVPPATYEHAFTCLSAVADWIDRARQARVDPGHDLTAELDLPARPPGWVTSPGHADALVLAVSSLRGQIDLAMHGLGRSAVPAEHSRELTRLQQTASRAATAAEYALSLHSSGADAALAEVIQHNLGQAVELWFQIGQLAAMPRLLAAGQRVPAQTVRAPLQTARSLTPMVSKLSAVARLELAAELVRAAGRAGADERIDPIVSAKFGSLNVQVPSTDVTAQGRRDLVHAYAHVLGVEPVQESIADGSGYWFKAVGVFQGCPVEAWAQIKDGDA